MLFAPLVVLPDLCFQLVFFFFFAVHRRVLWLIEPSSGGRVLSPTLGSYCRIDVRAIDKSVRFTTGVGILTFLLQQGSAIDVDVGVDIGIDIGVDVDIGVCRVIGTIALYGLERLGPKADGCLKPPSAF